MTDPVRNQIARAKVSGRASDPLGMVMDRILGRSEAIKRAQLDVATYAAKRNVDMEQHKAFRESHKEMLAHLSDKGILNYTDSPLGGVSFKFDPNAKKQETAPAEQGGTAKPPAALEGGQNTAEDVNNSGVKFDPELDHPTKVPSMLDHPRNSNLTPIFQEPKYDSDKPDPRLEEANRQKFFN